MSIIFYPNLEDAENSGTLDERIEVLMEAAEHFKAIVLDAKAGDGKHPIPREQKVAFNWQEISFVLRTVRELPEGNKQDKSRKGTLLSKLAEIYEVLRAAKMPKLETVRVALTSEAAQLQK